MPKINEPVRSEVAAHIGKSVVVKGELSGSEDLYLDGEVEGTIELRDHTLIVGPNGRIRAHISAREVVIHGKAEGNVTTSERVELKKSCVLVGDISTQRIVIEDGAFFKGSVDLHKESKPEPRKVLAASASVAPAGAAVAPVISSQASLLEHK
ncbi:MAG TPA: polymer-forming cytoskeletal protein [Candidatus Angelobacter sp.]